MTIIVYLFVGLFVNQVSAHVVDGGPDNPRASEEIGNFNTDTDLQSEESNNYKIVISNNGIFITSDDLDVIANGVEVIDNRRAVDDGIAMDDVDIPEADLECDDAGVDVDTVDSIAFGGPVKAHGTVSIVRTFPGLSTHTTLSPVDPDTSSIASSEIDSTSTVTTYYTPTLLYPKYFYYPLPNLAISPYFNLASSQPISEDENKRTIESEVTMPFSGMVPASGTVTIVGKF